MGHGEKREAANRDGLQNTAGDQCPFVAEAQRRKAAGRDARQRCDETERGAHRTDQILGHADIVVERIGHRTHHEIGQTIKTDRRQHRHGHDAVRLEEHDEGSGDRVVEAAHAQQRQRDGPRIHHFIGAHRFGRNERRGQTDPHQHTVQGVGDGPTRMLRHDQNDRVGRQQRHAIAELIGRRQQAKLVIVGGGFDAPSVDDDVLRRGRERGGERKAAQQHKAVTGSHQRHRNERGADEELGDRHPAAPPPQPAEGGSIDAVDDRRPQNLQRVGDAHPRQKPDRGEGGAFIAQPIAQRIADQQERQARGKAQHQHDERLGLKIGG